MSLPDELQSLAALKAKGALTEQEFAQAKAAVIAKYGGTSTATPVATAAQHKQGGAVVPNGWVICNQCKGAYNPDMSHPTGGYCLTCWGG
mgnify:CR=1 FL=1